ncbi:MAG: polyribonucleotide nucleotidyltransferase [Candidatus Magasanikbacteria bacterium RIFCSPHIGHO2_01_FULL_41_23]|uniref:Polyribonucleotide nucleotidyltransferase n=1 Tax=Candidatus Magasanikbacteria bacterium RIFCSPLOWO2_01_FULL_40_15 TaxID=1798686 RepID=A0A1F6N3B9_9BACT|nr:MAG: polyribonucleotide nucleotidyltransferase [Candidatus Magasanikbacteria bacterium RIFCSPHIGHO2_01_FULL_41_23]OGH67107.1 MAG: polyribonucleotide nucleotidyltransferase [Candidatus Magasanikbacteria bacterium RIFCSPHIGHO2_02_FULL_41_35]OGH76427.1 MAG: polyribonucleotide nucleotidyltransferase [Candidatus Magasanikbacteria bacterium RIFCSPHIGHO2_12_FULL_41_16]OGH78374.1 MAG: polyribonucleotide nucleotidyltransferase [Candidatus Magasanikbacteria bacterium RIFCSPLOWO2_01_FULL_40_15]
MLDIKSWSLNWGGRTLTVETGRFALQSTRSVTVSYGETVIMATVVKSQNIRPGLDYFPLMVDFEEKLYAAGKIKGSRFIKREGRPSDESIVMGRLVDRSIRPLFDDRMRNDVQVVITPLAIDGENDAAIIGLVASCAVLTLSSLPWNGPIAAARVGLDKNGEFILNITQQQLAENGTLDLVVAGTKEKLVMTEASAYEVPEEIMLKAIKWGMEQIQPVVDWLQKIQAEAGTPKEVIDSSVEETPIAKAKNIVKKFIDEVADTLIFNSVKISRAERVAMLETIKNAVKEKLTAEGIEDPVQAQVFAELKYLVGDVISKRILDKEQRLDGRKLTEIRELQIAVDLLPRVHGSGMFMRGDTQVLSIVTLGAPGDVQTLDTMEEEGKKRYMHHYNDTPFAYGEAGPIRGPGRRAIGHGALAERALEPVLPPEIDFPYAIRVVSEVFGSNGSSSMASTCGSTLSLMAAGVPIKKPVAGIAMGLASSEPSTGSGQASKWKVLTDLQDIEDGHGGMDFKIAGTRDGITAIQMDTKTQGLSWEIIEQTIKQARDARLVILDTMKAVIAEPRPDLSEYAPRIVTIQIDPEKIRDVIGPGGKIINKIIAETGVQIDIEQDGRVMITSNDKDGMAKAIKMVEDIVKEVQAGELYEGPVVRLEDFGAFVQILPNKDGLVHVSEISWNRVGRPSDVLKMGEIVKVKVKEIDGLGRVNLTIKELTEKPEGWVPPPAGAGPSSNPRPSGGRPFGGPPRRNGGFRDR